MHATGVIMTAIKGRGLRFMIWTLAIVAALALAGYAALQIAIARNGPAVLDTVDRITSRAANIERMETVRFGEHPAQKLVVLRQQGLAPDAMQPVVVFQHGGSWKNGDPEDYSFIGRSFAPHGFVAVVTGYRLGEDGKFPAMLEDGAAALAWIRTNIAALGGNPDHIVLMGHSAGAYNVGMLALDQRWLERENVPFGSVRGVVGLAGPYDFYPFDSESTQATFGEFDDPDATQPVNFSHADAPPFLLVHGEQDTTVRARNSHALLAHLKSTGVGAQLLTFSEMDHTVPLLRLASPWRRDGEMHEAIRQFIANPQTSVPVQGEMR